MPILREIRPEDVVAEATKAAELGPDDPVVLVRAGHILINEGDREAARSCASRANELMPPDSIFMADLDNLTGRVAARMGEHDLAEEKFRSAQRREPESFSHSRSLARFFWARGRDEDALTVIDESLRRARDDKDRDLLEQLRSEIAAG